MRYFILAHIDIKYSISRKLLIFYTSIKYAEYKL